jgi:hypothetical protein
MNNVSAEEAARRDRRRAEVIAKHARRCAAAEASRGRIAAEADALADLYAKAHSISHDDAQSMRSRYPI